MAPALGGHLPQRIGQERVPVAIAKINGQTRPVAGKFFFEPRDQGAVLLVDRAFAAELIVVLGHGQHALARDIFAAEHVFQKRNHVLRALWPTEGDKKQRVVGGRVEWQGFHSW